MLEGNSYYFAFRYLFFVSFKVYFSLGYDFDDAFDKSIETTLNVLEDLESKRTVL